MENPIQQTNGEVAIVIYDAPLPPRYFKVTKKLIRTLFVVVPVLFILTLLILFLWGMNGRIQEAPGPALPDMISTEDSKVAALEAEVKSLQASNNEFALKLSAQPAIATGEDPYLMGIKKPYGMQNFLNENRVSLDQFQFVQDVNKAALKFQIISAKPETKVTGHIIVFMISDAGMMAWPNEANKALIQGIKYSTGEAFSVSRLRPTNAEFSTQLTGESVKFMIYIFNREGDLLHVRETDSFKLGKK